MGWVNYHGHCNYCDGNGKPVDYVTSALEKGMAAIGFSSHAPVPFDSFWNMPHAKLGDYIKEINGLKREFQDRIAVHLSLEIDYIEDLMGPSDPEFFELGLDYTVGSVHFVNKFDDGGYWAIDGSLESFKKGFQQIYSSDIKRLVSDYFRLQRQLIELHRPTIIGHLDKIKMHNVHEPFFDESATWYREELRFLLETIARSGTIVEINTKSFVRNGLAFPANDTFAWLSELKIPIVINSDAHYPEHLTQGFEEIATQLKNSGIHEVAFLKNGKWMPVVFDKLGVIV